MRIRLTQCNIEPIAAQVAAKCSPKIISKPTYTQYVAVTSVFSKNLSHFTLVINV